MKTFGQEPGENELIAFPDKTKETHCYFLHVYLSSYQYRLHLGTMYRIHKNVWDDYEH